LEESIKVVLERSLIIHSAVEGVTGSDFRRKAALTAFFPKWNGSYSYSRVSPASKLTGTAGGIVSISATNNYNFNTSLEQPLFHGGSILANYRLEKMGVDLSKTDLETVKRESSSRCGRSTIF
jgi:outer membrane protein TolC